MAWTQQMVQLAPALVLGERELCRTLLEDALRLADTPYAKLEVCRVALEYAARFQEWQYAETFGDEALARARRSHGRWYIAHHCRSLGSHRRATGRLDEADALLSEAADLFRALDCPWDLAFALRESALLRRTQHRDADATALLQESIRLFDANGARPDAERARAMQD